MLGHAKDIKIKRFGFTNAIENLNAFLQENPYTQVLDIQYALTENEEVAILVYKE